MGEVSDESEGFDALLPQRDRLNQTTVLILKISRACNPIPTFTNEAGELFAESEDEAYTCGCLPKFEPGVERLWFDPDGRLVLGVREEERGAFSTRRSCVVRSPVTESLGRVVIKTSKGKQNNTIQDMDYRTVCTFFRESKVFHSMKTCFKLMDGQEVALLKHKRRGREVRIQFSDCCQYDMKILVMAAAVLFQKRDQSADEVMPPRDQVQFSDLIMIPHDSDKQHE